MRYDLTDFEWSVIEPVLPKGRPGPRRKDDRRVLNGIFWVMRAGAPWRDLPVATGPTRPLTIVSTAGARRVCGTG
jgi:transposase